MSDMWPDIKSAARAIVLAWAVILVPIITVTTIVQTVNPQAFQND